MSAMKDITNNSPITAVAHHERPADENVFVATNAIPPRPSRGSAPNKRIKYTTASTSSEEETTSAEYTKECAMSSVFLTPTEHRHFSFAECKAQEGCSFRKRLRLSVENGINERVPIPITLNGLTKAQLVNLVKNLVCERHPELEQVNLLVFNLRGLFLKSFGRHLLHSSLLC